MRRIAPVLAAAFAVLLSSVPATPAAAHPGLGGTTVGTRLEGENYATADSACDPDFDGEHTTVNGPAAQMPHSGCGINYGTVTFQYSGSFATFRANTWSGTGETVTSRVEIVVDGAIAASGTITLPPGSADTTVEFASASPISAGAHSVRVQYTTTSGPNWTNLRFDFAEMNALVTQVRSKQTNTGCTQPATNTEYDIRDPLISHWITYHVARSPMDIKRIYVWDVAGEAVHEDIRQHNGMPGDWCAWADQAINGTFFQTRPGAWHIETYFKTASGTWARVGSNLGFTVWPKLSSGGVYKNTVGDGITSFTTSDSSVNVATTWSTTSARSTGHTVRFRFYRPDGVEHHATPLQPLSSGTSAVTLTDSMSIAGTGASAFLGTWSVRTWIDDVNYLERGTFFFTLAAATAPPNNNWANRITLTSLPYTASVSNVAATLETSEPRPCGSIGATIWYAYTPSVAGTLTVDTLHAASFDTVVAVYTAPPPGSLATLISAGCNDNFSGTKSQVSATVGAGATYYIQVGGNNSATGTTTLRVQFTANNQFVPANDDYANATPIGSATPYTTTQSTANATREPGEGFPCTTTAGATVWFQYTHPSSSPTRRMYVDTMGSSYNTAIGVWSGATVTNNIRWGCNDNARGVLQSQTSWEAAPGTAYYIQVGGVSNATGTLKLRLVEATILALGDSVVAGHGIGPNPTGYPHNSPDAYAGLLGGDLKMRVFNRAATGACAWSASAGGHGSTPSYCSASTTSTIIKQLSGVTEIPTHVVIGVGANDIQFESCLRGFMENTTAQSNCKDPTLAPRLTALTSNVREVIRRVKALSTPAPDVVVVGYYNPFSDAPTDPNHVCDMWMPAAIARNQQLAKDDHNSSAFRTATLATQREGYAYAVDVLGRLNGALSSAEAAEGDGVAFTTPNFAGHDMCVKVRGGTTANTWVYGPDWDDHFTSWWLPNRDYHSRAMPGLCPYPIMPYDEEDTTEVHDSSFFGYDYEMNFRPNCMVHPTTDGHRGLANAVRPFLPIA